MNKYRVGTHKGFKNFDCLGCAEKYYNELGNCKKYLSKLGFDNFPKKIILNNYGWKND